MIEHVYEVHKRFKFKLFVDGVSKHFHRVDKTVWGPFLEFIPHARAFVIDGNLIGNSRLSEEELEGPKLKELQSTIPALPFKTCAFEAFNQVYLFEAEQPPSPMVIVIHELAHGDFLFFEMVGHAAATALDNPVSFRMYDSKQLPPEIRNQLVNMFLRILQRGRLGSEKVNERIRIGQGQHRHLVKIRDLVRVTDKKNYLQAPSLLGGEIDWSHRWEVMGHWRNCRGIGKDRDNHYSVFGKTWIVPHTKGPKDKPLVVKTRFYTKPKTIETEAKNS